MPQTWKKPRKLLCATDLTPGSDRVVDRALQLASEWQASLLVAHVIDDTGLQSGDFTALTRDAETELTRQIKAHPLSSGLEIESIVTLGKPAERLLTKCDRLFIDLLVMGPGERTALGRRLLGSTIHHVLRHALQPVLAVRSPAVAPYRAMAVATDFSAPSRVALECALALFPDTKATVVHGYDDALRGLMPFDQVSGPLAERHKQEMRAAVEKSMREFAEPMLALKPDLATAVHVDTPEAALRHHLASGSDLAVVGTHGRTGLRRAVIGSVAERLIGTLECDVLAVRSAD